MVSLKGKEVAGKGLSGKRNRDNSDKTGRPRKRKNRGVLQFFEDSAYEIDEDDASDESDFDDDFLEDEFKTQVKVKNEPGKAHHLPFLPKEEELSEEELEKMMEERYKPGSSFVTYAEDVYESKRSIEGDAVIPSLKDPTIWKVKCMVGRERHSAFCLMQKYVDLHSLGTKLQIISAFALEHVKGFIYIEAEKQFDVNEACKGFSTIYSSRVAPVTRNEVSHLLSVRSKHNEVSVGTWARVKNGKYKGDLAQVIAVNDARKKATVKLIPRIDLQAMAEKFGGGIASKKTATPTPRLITSTELEEFRPLIQYRRDRDTGEAFEVLDGLMLKDGYLYKKVSIDSLNFWGVVPSEDELLKFEPSKKEESGCQEWLTQLYGEQKKKHIIKRDKGGGKGEGSSSSSMASSFEVHDLVLFGRKDFGIIVGTEKDDYFKILKEGSEGPVVVTVELHQLKNVSFDKKFTALDHLKKIISINDTVKVLEGPLQGRQGIVKQIYRGIIFLYDENEQENSGYICCKSQICEKNKLFDGACKGKGGELGSLGFEDFLSSPKSPLSPKKAWQAKENSSNFNREDKDGMFSIGQSLRIRVGPLKGYLCRVMAIRRSDVTVKLDSQQKILTVKCEHLAEVRGKSSAISLGDDAESIKPFDLLGTQDCSTDWMAGAGTSAEGDRWGTGGPSTERSSWPALTSSGFSLQSESNGANPLISVENDTNKDVGDAWASKVTPNQKSSWGSAVPDEKAVSNNEQVGVWGKSDNSWKKGTANAGVGSVTPGSWGGAKISSGDQVGTSKDAGDKWNIAKLKTGTSDSSNDAAPFWGKKNDSSNNQDDGWKKSEEPLEIGKNATENLTSGWSTATAAKNKLDSWGKGKDGGSDRPTWGKAVDSLENQTGGWGNAGGKLAESGAEASGWKKATSVAGGQTESWGNMKKDGGSTGWGNGGSSLVKAVDSLDRSTGKGTEKDDWAKAAEKWGNKDDSSGSKAVWNSSASAPESQTGGWDNAGGSSWNKQDGGSSWNKQGGGSWSKQAGGSWNKQADMNTANESKERPGQNDSWGKPSGGGRVFGGWNKDRMGNKDDTDQQEESWERTNTFDGGHGSGGRRGRGGSRGGRDQFGRGRSFGWGKEGQEYHKDSVDSWGKGKDGGSDGSGFGGSKATWNGSMAAPGNQSGGWGKTGGNLAQSEAGGSAWKKSTTVDGGQTESWRNMKKDGGETGWGSGGSGWGKVVDSQDRSTGKGAQEDSWGKAAEKWNSKDASGTKVVWNSSAAAAPENQTQGWANAGGSSWNKQDGGSWNKQGAGSSWSKQAGGSSWTKQTDTNRDESNEGTDQKGSWGKPSGGDQGFGGWNKSGMGNKDGWSRGEAGGWGRGKVFDGGEDNRSDTGGYGSRGGSERGGFGGRGRSDRGGYGGRGGSERGAFRGRGSSERGGFGGRGRGRRDHNGDWNSRNDASEDKPSGYGSSWNQGGGGDKGQSWNSGWKPPKGDLESGGADAQAGGWNQRTGSGWKSNDGEGSRNQGGGWSQSSGSGWKSNDGGGSQNQGGGWSQGSGSGWKSNDGGGSRNQGGVDKSQSWNSGWKPSQGAPGSGGAGAQGGGWSQGSGSGRKSNDGGGSWNQGGGDKSQSWNSGWKPSQGAPGSGGAGAKAGGWNQGTGSAKDAGVSDVAASGGWTSQASSWNKGNGGSSGTSNQPKVADGVSSAGSDVAVSGGWTSQASSWNKGNGGSSGTWNQPKVADGVSSGGSDVAASGGWTSQASSWNKGNGGSSGTWNQPKAADGGQSSGWNQPKDSKGESEDGGPANPWGKAAASSSGKDNGGGSKWAQF